MVDSRAKGTRAEAALVSMLKIDTELNWKRVPGSGMLHADHGLKGDVYVPNEHNLWAVEVKHYKECQLTSKILTDKDPMLFQWWDQAVRQGKQTSKEPLLFFKHDRSKWFVMINTRNVILEPKFECIMLPHKSVVIMTYDEFMLNIDIKWIK